jgi:cyclic di-GMP phosphodiesterase
MHDIGKVAIPDAILLKAGALTRDEWAVMKTHTTLGAQLLSKGKSPYLQMGAEIALYHHERWDGAGYPEGLKGQLRSERAHKKALSHSTAVEVITVGDGRTLPSHFDPDILQAFTRCAERFRNIFESIQD